MYWVPFSHVIVPSLMFMYTALSSTVTQGINDTVSRLEAKIITQIRGMIFFNNHDISLDLKVFLNSK